MTYYKNNECTKNNIREYNYYIFSIFYFLYVYPILEWFAHYMLHKINERRHKRHHILFFNNSVRTERWPLIFIAIGYYLKNYIIMASFLYYFVIHTCIHKFPSLLPKITEHHISHHKDQRYNFCVSAIWPDKMFKTYKPIE